MAVGRTDKPDLALGANVQTFVGSWQKVRHCVCLFFPITNDIAPIGKGIETQQRVAPDHGRQNRQWGDYSGRAIAIPLPTAAQNEDLRIPATPLAHEAYGH